MNNVDGGIEKSRRESFRHSTASMPLIRPLLPTLIRQIFTLSVNIDIEARIV